MDMIKRTIGKGAWLSAGALVGCGGLLVQLGLQNPTTNITRQVPAEHDLAGTTTVAVAPLQGKPEDSLELAGQIAGQLAESGRFMIVERDRLETIARERNCEVSDVSCLSADLPATAVIFGSVTQSRVAENVESSTYECGNKEQKKQCTSLTRKAAAHFGASMRLVDTGTGKVLFQRVIKETAHAQTNGSTDSPPAAIDGPALLTVARERAARQFTDAISPHNMVESVELEEDGDIPEIGRGVELALKGEYADAVREFKAAVQSAESNLELDPDEVAKAHYDLAVGHAALADYQSAKKGLDKALALADEDHFRELRRKLDHWQADAEKAQTQLALAQAPAVVTAASASGSGAGTAEAPQTAQASTDL